MLSRGGEGGGAGRRGKEAEHLEEENLEALAEWPSPPLCVTRCTPSTRQAALLLHQFGRQHLLSRETSPHHAPPENPGTCFFSL